MREKYYVFISKKKRCLIRLLDTFFFIIFFFFRLHKKKILKLESVDKILLVRLDQLGDVLLTTPAIRALRKYTKKSARIYFLLSNKAKDILKNNPNIDELIEYEASWFWGTKFSLFEFIRLIKKIRSIRFDVGVDFRGDLRNILLMWLGGVRFKVGYGITGGGFLLDKEVDYKHDKGRWVRHEVDRNLDLVASLVKGEDFSYYYDNKRLEVFCSELDDNNMAEYFKEKKFIIGIHPGSLRPAKLWPGHYFSKLIEILINNNFNLVLFEGPSDKDVIQDIFKNLNDNIKSKILLIQPASIARFISMIKNIDLLVCVNSFAMHVADALSTKTVVIFSAADSPDAWGPLNRKNKIILYKDVACKFCGRFICREHVCMKGITVEEVFEAIKKLSC